MAAVVMLVALAAGPASAFLHSHEAGASDDHCAVCHEHHTCSIETEKAHVVLETLTQRLKTPKSDAGLTVCLGTPLSRGPPLASSL